MERESESEAFFLLVNAKALDRPERHLLGPIICGCNAMVSWRQCMIATPGVTTNTDNSGGF